MTKTKAIDHGDHSQDDAKRYLTKHAPDWLAEFQAGKDILAKNPLLTTLMKRKNPMGENNLQASQIGQLTIGAAPKTIDEQIADLQRLKEQQEEQKLDIAADLRLRTIRQWVENLTRDGTIPSINQVEALYDAYDAMIKLGKAPA